MINSTKIKEKANKLYRDFLISLIDQDEEFFPYDQFSIGQITKNDALKLQLEIMELLENSKNKQGFGYTVELENRKIRSLGEQSLPKRVVIETELDYLKLINKEKEVKHFKENLTLILFHFPELQTWLSQHPVEIINHQDKWQDLFKVFHYFQQNQQPNLYIRELPIQVHTKFIEENSGIIRKILDQLLPIEAINTEEKDFAKRFYLKYSEPLIRLRFLDDDLQKASHFLINDFKLPLSEFRQLDFEHYSCLITENLMNFLTLPPLKGSIAIWGRGFAIGYLKEIAWLKTCQIYYWGDLDAAGFQILSQLRTYFPQTISLMMDQKTYQQFSDFSVSDPKATDKQLSHLTSEENKLYIYLCENQIRLEQERIEQAYVNQYINLKAVF